MLVVDGLSTGFIVLLFCKKSEYKLNKNYFPDDIADIADDIAALVKKGKQEHNPTNKK